MYVVVSFCDRDRNFSPSLSFLLFRLFLPMSFHISVPHHIKILLSTYVSHNHPLVSYLSRLGRKKYYVEVEYNKRLSCSGVKEVSRPCVELFLSPSLLFVPLFLGKKVLESLPRLEKIL